MSATACKLRCSLGWVFTPIASCRRLHPATFRSGLSEISAPSSLELLPKRFPVSGEQLEQYQRASAPAPLPLRLREGRPAHVEVMVGDDVSSIAAGGVSASAALRLALEGAAGCELEVMVGRDSGSDAERSRVKVDADGRAGPIPLRPNLLRQGLNRVELLLVAGSSAEVVDVRIDVRYGRRVTVRDDEPVVAVGRDVQLFFDDFAVSSAVGLTRHWPQPEKREAMVIPGEPQRRHGGSGWTAGMVICFGSVLYDDEEELFKMWYGLHPGKISRVHFPDPHARAAPTRKRSRCRRR